MDHLQPPTPGRSNAIGTHLRFRLLALVAAVASTALNADPLRAGAATSCVTPALGAVINGGLGPGVARHIHDDLFARALVLDDGTTRLAFVVVDTCLLDRPIVEATKELIERNAGLPRTRVMISATHTHSGGSVCGAHLTEADPEYRAWLPGRIADAAQRAVSHLAPARLGWASGSLPQHVFCRRLLVKPGMVYTNQLGATNELAKMNWDSPHLADGDPTGPVDPEVFVVSVRHADGRPLALLANYSLHYVGDVGPGHVSADYFGVFADRIQELLGADRQDPPFVGILCNGTSGDINNINPRAIRSASPPYTQIRRVADDTAREVLRVTRSLVFRDEVQLAAAQSELRVATRRPGPAEVEQARTFLGGRTNLASWNDNFAREQLLLAEYPTEVELPIQVFRIGEVAVAAWPGEIFAVSGLRLKERSPVKPLFNVGLANGWFGYIPPPEQFALGAYETWRMRTSPLETNATVKMTEAFLDLLEDAP